MKKTILRALTLVTLLAVTTVASAQKPKVLSGSPENLSSIRSWEVEIEFNEPMIHKKGEYSKFLEERIKEMNEVEEEAGDNWKADWDKNISKKYETKFVFLMNKYLAKTKSGKIDVKKSNDEADGKIIVKTYWIYLGYVNPMMAQPSKVSSKIYFLDSDGKELLVVDMVESPGQPNGFSNPGYATTAGFGFNPEGEFLRMTESFAKCGKDLAGYLAKKAYKK